MATTSTKKLRFSPGREHKLTDKQRVFVAEYVIDLNATRAATAAGYSPKTAASMGCQLLDQKAYPLVAAEVRKALAEKELRAEKKADDVLRYIHTAMFYQPLRYFTPGDGGGWLIDEDKLDTLPPYIGCLIEEVELRTVVLGAGQNRKQVTKVWVRLVSKTAAMTLAAKHQLGDKVNSPQLVNIDWSAMLTPGATGENEVDRMLADLEQLPDHEEQLPCGLKELPATVPPSEPATDPPANRLECKPSRNGHGHE